MRRYLVTTALVLGTALCGNAFAAPVTLPDTSQTTTLTATVSEQCDIVVPAGIAFNVTNVAAATNSAAQTVSVTNIVLATAAKKLKISLQANAADFTSANGGTTWAAGDVSWNAPAWTNATGVANTLSNLAYNEVSTSDAGVSSCSTNALVFTLGAKAAVNRAGNHTLAVTWKVESI